MNLGLSATQLELRDQVRRYFAELLTPEVRARVEREGHGGPESRRLRRQMGTDGWLGIAWPEEYGGRGLSPLENYIFREEAERATVPVSFLTLDTIGPTLMRHGSEEQRAAYLPGILRGELLFAVGYSEPNAGTDLAALTTRAVRDGDEYVINGTKAFTTHADVADYIWLAARTGRRENRHAGISILIVPTDTPGLTVTPMHTLVGERTTMTYYEDVRVPSAQLVGPENGGWKLITAQLNRERALIGVFAGRTFQLLDDVLGWARTTATSAGGRVIDIPWVQIALARVHALLEPVRLHNLRLAAGTERGELGAGDASMVKTLASEVAQEAAQLMLQVLGEAGGLCAGSPGAELEGRLERAYRSAILHSFGGGTNEIQREITARMSLGMPRVR
jgi:3-oxocholest-4-en-26-oyl-CoA dehydrogenase alpha subunit